MGRVSSSHSVTVAAGATTVLALAAAGMTSGQWLQLTGANLPSGLAGWTGTAGLPGHEQEVRSNYASKMAFDPDGDKIYFVGAEHGNQQYFLIYDFATNAWSTPVSTPWGAPTRHGYDHNTFNTQNGEFLHRESAAQLVHRWNGSSWSAQYNFSGSLGYVTAANGVEFFPTLGTNGSIIVFQDENGTQGEIIGIDPVTSGITTYASGATLDPVGDPHSFAVYNSVSDLVAFGGGNSVNTIWTINSAGTVAAKTAIPAELTDVGSAIDGSRFFANPSNGNFVCIKNATVWYDFNPTANTWTARGGTPTVLTGNLEDAANPTAGVITCTLREYGVVAFIKGYSASAPAEMWLWKP